MKRGKSTAAITLKDLLEAGAAELREASDSPARDAERLLCHATGITKVNLICAPNRLVTEAMAAQYQALIQRRRTGEPIAYLIGTREFWSLPLRITPATLIPRPETELLVECALARIPPNATTRVLDLGTGSGAIALAIARERPHAHVFASDVSGDALAVAQHNARTLNIDNVHFFQGEWYAPFDNAQFDVIVSNPPYIAAGDPHLNTGDLRFEPALALSCGNDGLEALRHIAQHSRNHLLPGGWLLMEHGYDQGPPLMALMASLGFREIVDTKDLADIPRVISGRWR